MDELTEKMSEARGMLSNLIFGKKQKKPRELVQTIQSYLQYLAIQQSQLALLSPNSQQQALSAASAAAAANAAAAASALLSPTGHTLVHSMTSPSSSVAASPSPSPTGNGGTPFGMASPNAGGQLQPLPQLPSSLNIASPSHAPISIIDPASGLPVPTQANNGPSAVTTPSAAASGADALPQSITAELDAIVIVLYGDTAAEATNKDPDPKTAREIIDLMFELDLFRRLLEQIRSLEFEARKFFTRIFEYALTQRRDVSVPYMLRRRQMILQCIQAYEEKDVSIALCGDAILKACIACEPIAEMMLQSGFLPETGSAAQTPVAAAAAAAGISAASTPSAAASTAVSAAPTPTATGNGSADHLSVAPSALDISTPTASSSLSFTSSASAAAAGSVQSSPTNTVAGADCGNMVLPFFRYLDLPTFINSHAFSNFKLLLTAFPLLSSQYLRANYDAFFARYNKLLSSENYLTKVQAFSFLGELLMERSNQEVMMRYVNEAEHLKLAMLALRGPKAIQLAVFNVLKIFVPNPYKADPILRILTQNKRNFLMFLDEFERDSEDETLVAHKAEMQHALLELPDSVPPLPKKLSAGSNEEANAQHQQQQQQLQQQQQQQQLQQQQQTHQPQPPHTNDVPLSADDSLP